MSFFRASAPISTGHLISLVYDTLLFVAHVDLSYHSDDLHALWGCGEFIAEVTTRQSLKIRRKSAYSALSVFVFLLLAL